jgi:uncharacterized protein (DUF427 family)
MLLILKAIANYYSIRVQNEVQANLQSTLEKNYNDMGKIISEIIFRAGLIA